MFSTLESSVEINFHQRFYRLRGPEAISSLWDQTGLHITFSSSAYEKSEQWLSMLWEHSLLVECRDWECTLWLWERNSCKGLGFWSKTRGTQRVVCDLWQKAFIDYDQRHEASLDVSRTLFTSWMSGLRLHIVTMREKLEGQMWHMTQ